MTGDGVNDAPALKQADCGTAVSGATDAARGAAALILTAPGLSVINSAIDQARQIFGRITSYTIYRVALTMDIMFLVVLSSIFLGFQPLTAVMIVIMSLLDDVPIMTIAYDNTPVSARPIRWQMPRLLGVSAYTRIFLDRAILRAVADRRGGAQPSRAQRIFRPDRRCAASVGHVPAARGRRSSAAVRHPHRTLVLSAAVPSRGPVLGHCSDSGDRDRDVRRGWLVAPISWKLIAAVWAYNIAWMFVMGAVRQVTEAFANHRTARHLRSVKMVSQTLRQAA